MTRIDGRLAALEKEAGDPAQHMCLVVTFPDSEKLESVTSTAGPPAR